MVGGEEEMGWVVKMEGEGLGGGAEGDGEVVCWKDEVGSDAVHEGL